MFEFTQFFKDDAGATAIEYGLIAALVAVAGVIAFTATGDTILTSFTNITDDFCTAVGGNFAITNTGENSCVF
ncbi:Flp family type IVb pilin [Sneathiella marina]|uniref:Flp family type IVb pilin n=1 Tax=Sneathiella marina TaxID=2950108 RepID=A0ABY4W6Y5_9PROT|nr:Flp family type IVb pilin [Sneathiella marina]USG62940.1 Flp family type IVb pilin [Sneathiella marina]